MATQVQRRRGTTTEHATFTGAEGELTVDTTKDTVVVHDGATAGGRALAREDLNNVSSTTVTGKVDAASTSAAGKVQLEDSTTSTSTTKAATPNSVKTAKDVADAALPKAGGTMTGQILGDDSTSASTPGYAFDGDGNTGMGRPGADQLALITGGTARLTIDSSGSVSIPGNLTVQGTTTTIDTTDLLVKDKNVVIGNVATPTDVTADGGGITLRGSTSKTFNWVDSTDSWTSSEHIDLASGKVFKINGTEVLSGTALGSNVLITSTNITDGTIVDGDISATAEIAVSKLADGAARQLLQTDAAGTGVEWTNNVDIPGTLDVTSTATFDGVIGASAGAAATPSITFTGDLNTGIYSPGADQVAVSTGGTQRLYIASDGKVGVGTSSPAALLHLSSATGSASPTPTELRIATTTVASDWSTTDPWGRISYYSADISDTGPKIIGAIDVVANNANGGRGRFDFKLSEVTTGTLTSRFVITETGNVGIGITAPGSALEINAAASTSPFIAKINTAEAARIDGSGRLLVGTSTALSSIYVKGDLGTSAATTPYHQLAVSGNNYAGASITSYSSSGYAGTLSLNSSKTSTIGNNVIVINNQAVGVVTFNGNDGTNFIPCAEIKGSINGTPGTDDMPGMLIFSTTSDGSATPTERMRIDSNGYVGLSQGIGNNAVDYSKVGPVLTVTIVNGGTGYTDGTYTNIPLTTETAQAGVAANFTVSGGVITVCTISQEGRAETGYVGAVLALLTSTALGAGGSGLSLTVASVRTAAIGWYATGPQRIRLGYGANTSTGTELGSILFSQRDSSAVNGISYGGAGDTARIVGRAAGTLGGGYLEFWTAANGAQAVETLRITATGTTTLTSAASTAPFIANISTSEVARIDSSGRLLVGTSTSVSVASLEANQQIFGSAPQLSIIRGSNNVTGPRLTLAKSRNTAIGSRTVVSQDDQLGSIIFCGDDGANLDGIGAQIDARVDGTPGAGDLPSRLVFSTSADGSATPTERMRITNDGVQAYNQPAPAAVNSTATLTIANLKAGIITSTSAAATDMTLPTGTLTEGGFSGVYTNMTFEWSVINTGPSLVRVLVGTDHSIVGSGSVAAGTSGRFASRRTAANTFVTYRLA